MTTPEIKDLIQPLEQYMTPDQKAELEKILSIGKKWKEEGEQDKQEFRRKNDRGFVQQILNYPEKKKLREEENKVILGEIGYEKMNVVEKNKFEKEFIEDLILYSYYTDIEEKKINQIGLEEFKEKGLNPGSQFSLPKKIFGSDTAEVVAVAQALEKTGGLKVGSFLNLGHNKIGTDGAVAIAEALAKTGGLKVGSTLELNLINIGDDGGIVIAEMLEKTDGLKEGSELDLSNNNIGDEGAKAIAEAIAKTGGLKNRSTLDLRANQIGYEGAKAIAEAIAKTGGLKEGSVLKLRGNEFGEAGKAVLQKIQDYADAKSRNCTITF